MAGRERLGEPFGERARRRCLINSQIMRKHLPYGRQVIEDDDIEAVVNVLRGDWLTTGPNVDDFEAALAERVNAKFAVSCSSGTAALHLAAMALRLGPNDAVVVPTLTFAALLINFLRDLYNSATFPANHFHHAYCSKKSRI